MERPNVLSTYDLEMQKACIAFCEDYKSFISEGKTERECCDLAVNIAEKYGFRQLSDVVRNKETLREGDKVYSVWMNKSVVLFRIGSEPIENGMNILGAHIDSPRLDIKQNPLYESGGFALMDTHYYGGIKKYQFVAMPMAIHGVIVKKDGETVVLNVGEDEDDPVFFFSDLLIHLARKQMDKRASEVIEGEMLDLIVGNDPVIIDASAKAGKKRKNPGKDAVKDVLLSILKENYGISEDDFESAELEIVPAGKARDAGFDRSMILGYGQDDRICAYPSLRAILDEKEIKRTAVCLLVDKEEIGSVGATGMRSRFFENALAEVMDRCGCYSELSMRRALANSCMLSSDVSAGYDPGFKSSFDEKNAAFLGKGMVFNKYTGSGGKSGSNDANAEYIAHLRSIFSGDGIVTQTSELGAVDAGGGGTIAYILALYGMNVIDCGIAVLNMHAPFEASNKADIYECYRGYCSFLRNCDFRNQ